MFDDGAASAVDILSVTGLQKSLGSRSERLKILGGIEFAAKPGEFLTIVGPSGCGKTTLLMSLAGLYVPDEGQVLFQGKAVDGPPEGLSVVFQDYSRSLLPWKRNIANVLFAMRRLKATKEEKRAIAMEMLEAVGLKGFEDRYPWELSGGMQQRVAIARALATRSKLLLLDEPLAAVDAQTRADMQDLLLRLAKQFNKTCILVTHDVEEAVYMADRIVVLSNRPTHVVEEIEVPLAKPRDHLTTREDPEFLRIRHEVIERIRSFKRS
ncbi:MULTISPECIES: ABC transporter ATP-binding protein [Maritimibacter]|jgi:NitT/TauT family transport system ATP-binding protein|uniref:ABC-type nitrate/sulfonate/taurine/bicarbonate transport systems, ATPase component-like protein n=1 Tax=Maritimibacter alkaliphilus HTCC2654 TaxID=314271 RepID=A3VAN2_9RHOB|nr:MULTISPECIES: ABC transporter ATP-binding protein [Maritimibacter]EAQ14973.1 ABC-type nitrate/sulfonate/taurine/bicarbonate transport systems, ATPase component-like protein [Maritimibacter alkaliphilus HTCC2654]TYP80802.1 NitT/TauT family transport system ATP-binding protein [Maritimibacter alkaliphilus HTCC2654]